jgi:hypothetical protein
MKENCIAKVRVCFELCVMFGNSGCLGITTMFSAGKETEARDKPIRDHRVL